MTISELKQIVWERDNWICQYCGKDLQPAYGEWLRWRNFHWGRKIPAKERPTVDHVKPRSKGGETNSKNLVTACWQCNNKKGSS